MKQVMSIIFSFAVLGGFSAHAETHKKGDEVFVSSGSIFMCKSEKRMRVRVETDILLDIAGCKILDTRASKSPFGKVTKIKTMTTNKKKIQIVEVKMPFKRRKNWFHGGALSAKPISDDEFAMDWFFDNAVIGEKFIEKEWKKNLGKFELLEVTKINLHEAYYFPSVNKTLAVNVFRNNRISYYRNGKNPN